MIDIDAIQARHDAHYTRFVPCSAHKDRGVLLARVRELEAALAAAMETLEKSSAAVVRALEERDEARAEAQAWRQNAADWRRLYMDVCDATSTGHNPRTAKAEANFRALADGGEGVAH